MRVQNGPLMLDRGAGLEPATRGQLATSKEMLGQYWSLAQLPEEERRARLRHLIFHEFTLEHDEMRRFTTERLRIWLLLAPDDAQLVAACYDSVMDRAPAAIAMSYVAMMQSVISDFSLAHQLRIRMLAPESVLGKAPVSLRKSAESLPTISWWSRLATSLNLTRRDRGAAGAPAPPA